MTDNNVEGIMFHGVAYVAPDNAVDPADKDIDPNAKTPLDSYEADKDSEAFKTAKRVQWAGKNHIMTPEEKELLVIAENRPLTKHERTRLYHLQAGADAKHRVLMNAQKKVSKKLLLAERAKRVTIVCDETGIVSQLDIPVVKGYALVWTSPFGSLDNCRGIAQKGMDYLKHLDTQVLAGILIKIAESYNLFTFQPSDSGAQKNALLRTAGKHHLINAIILIEDLVHSGNSRYLQKLSLISDVPTMSAGIEFKLKNYIALLSESIAKPDKEEYDENAESKYKIKPVLAPKTKYLSIFQVAEKEWEKDKKEGKQILKELMKEFASVNPKLVQFIAGLLTDNNLLIMPAAMTEQVVDKLESRYPDSENQKKLSALLRKDRTMLKRGASVTVDDEEKDNVIQTAEVADNSIVPVDNPTVPSEPTDSVALSESGNDKVEPELVAPEGLSFVEKRIWIQKYKNAMRVKSYEQNQLPSTAVYVPSALKQKMGEE